MQSSTVFLLCCFLLLLPVERFASFLELLHHLRILQDLSMMLIWNMPSFLQRGSSKHTIFPCLDSGKVGQFNPCPSAQRDPSPMGNVCNGAFIADEVFIAGILEMLIKDSIQALEFILVARCRVLVVFFRITNELESISADDRLL